MEKNMYNSGSGRGRKSGLSKTTIALCCIAAFLMIVVIVMMVMLLFREPEVPEVPATEPPVVVTEAPTEAPTEPEETQPEMLEKMAELYEQNPDTFGWIRIADTKLDYPVMHTPDDPQKYNRLDFDGQYDKSGLPFMAARCNTDPESTNLIVYGHNMRNGTAFRTLHSYADKEFWEENPIIEFSTLYEEREYEIFAVFYDKIYDAADTRFKYYHFVDPETEEEFDEGVQYFLDNSIYDTEIEVEYGDRFLMLITCSYHTDYGRLVVVGRMIADDAESQQNG